MSITKHSSNTELVDYFISNGCNETPDSGQVRKNISYISGIIALILILLLKLKIYEVSKWYLYLPVGIFISQYLQGSMGL